MTTSTLPRQAPNGNGAFSAFVFSIVGWALIEAWCVAVGAPVVFQALVALAGIGVAAVARGRYRRQWPVLPPAQQRRDRARQLRDAGACLLLLAAGYILGQLVLAGWVSPVLVFAAGLTFVPWSRVPLCRRHFLTAATLFCAGAGCPLLFSAGAADPTRLIAAAWLWSTAICALLHKY